MKRINDEENGTYRHKNRLARTLETEAKNAIQPVVT